METKFITHELKFNCKLSDIFTLIPFGDIHRDTLSCDVDRWKWFLYKAKKIFTPNTLFICMGDVNDFASAKEQDTIRNSKLHDQTIDKFDQIVQKDNRLVASEISFMKGNIIGMLDGNHNWVFHDGSTATEDLCNRLNAPYLGWLTHITLRFLFPHGRQINVYIVACHGKAGGKLAGSSINQVEDLKRIFPIADIYIMGHDHARGAWPTSILIPGSNGSSIKQKRQFLARSGSFKKAYTEGVSSYEVGRLLRPSDLGAIVFNITFHRDTKITDRIITDISATI